MTPSLKNVKYNLCICKYEIFIFIFTPCNNFDLKIMRFSQWLDKQWRVQKIMLIVVPIVWVILMILIFLS